MEVAIDQIVHNVVMINRIIEHQIMNRNDRMQMIMVGINHQKKSEHQNPKPKQQQPSSKESKPATNTKSNTEETPTSSQTESQTKRPTGSADTTESTQNDERPSSSSTTSQKNPNAPTKNRPSIQIYNPAERAKLRRQQNPSS